MKRSLFIVLVLFSFFSGAFAQSISGGFVNIVQAAVSLLTTLTFVGNQSFSGASSANNSWIWSDLLQMSGTASIGNNSGETSPFQLYISNDIVNTTTNGYGFLSYLNMKGVAETNHSGGRNAIQGHLWVKGTPSVVTTAGYVGVLGTVQCSANLTGNTGIYTNYKGGCFGGGSNVFTSSGATFLNLINGQEFDVSLVSGSSSADKYGISVVKGSNDAVRGTYDDAAISINDQDGSAVGWHYGISFGSYAHQWAFANDSILIGAQIRQTGPSSSSIAAYGIDLSNVTFTTSGAPIRMPLITPANSTETCSQGSMKWDANFIYICTAPNVWKRSTLSAF